LIDDLNVQLSITHTHTSYLDAYLTGPEGQRIELFAEIGREGDHFDNTILDDQARYPIMKARPPFRGTCLPNAVVKKQPSLSHFSGKSVKGIWQLVIRGTRSERFGMLHSWSLIVKPQEDFPGSAPVAPLPDGPQLNAMPTGSETGANKEAVRKTDVSPEEYKKTWEAYKRSATDKSRGETFDYETMGKQIMEAVKTGKLTEDQAKAKWAAIEKMANAKGKGDKEDVRADPRGRRGR